jgi:hypothetical protein
MPRLSTLTARGHRIQKRPFGFAQRGGEAPRPLGLPGAAGHEILTDLDFDVRQAAPLGMTRNRVVGRVADEIRLIVRDDQIRI